MVTLIDFINRILTPIFDIACWPFQNLSPIWAMTAISLVTGVFMVWIFGKVSDQKGIKKIREHIRGNLIGVRLFQSDIGVVLRLQRRIFGDTFHYMRHALVPMVILIVPVVLIMTQLNLRFASKPLDSGEPAIIKAYLRDTSSLNMPISLEVGDGLSLETNAVRMPTTREVAWRVRVRSKGEHKLTVRVGESTVQTRVVSGNRWTVTPQRRTGRGVLDTLLYPGEPPIPIHHPVEAIEIGYPALELSAFGWPINWLTAFFIMSIAFGFAFKGFLGVEV